MRVLAAVTFAAIALAGCVEGDSSSVERCSPEDSDVELGGAAFVEIGPIGDPHIEDGPPIERGIPFEITILASEAPDRAVIEESGADLVVRDSEGQVLYRRHETLDSDEWPDRTILSFWATPCYLGASYDFDYGSRSIPLGIQISDAAACSGRATAFGHDGVILMVIDDTLETPDHQGLGPQPFMVSVGWYPGSPELQAEGATMVLRVDGDIVDTVKGWPEEDGAGSFHMAFEQIPCIMDAEYYLEYPGHSLRWYPNLLE